MASWRPWYRLTVRDCDGLELAWEAGGPGLPDLQSVDVVARLASGRVVVRDRTVRIERG